MSDAGPMRGALDTNVLVAAPRARQGASFALASCIPSPEFVPCLSIGLYAEWQGVLTRAAHLARYLASQSHLQEIHFLWRPFLPDPNDDMVLELALAAGCRHIITHYVRDCRGSEKLGVTALGPP